MAEEKSPLDLTVKQQGLLDQFRKQTSDILKNNHDDLFLLRWLRARDFDLRKSEKMLRDSMEWRKQYKADELLDWNPPEVLIKYIPATLLGYDKSGSPLWIAQGDCDVYGILHSVSQMDFTRYVLKLVETTMSKMPSQTSKTGHVVHQLSVIFDVEQLPYKTVTWKTGVTAMLNTLKAFEANYPEVLRKVYVINASKIFTILWAMIKPFLDECTAKKIHIFGTEKWKDAFLQDIDAEVLPVYWGGTRTDDSGDPKCPTQVILGAPVPESYYFQRNKDLQAVLDDMEIITINKADSVRLEYEAIAGQTIRWIFKTADHDIGFGVKLRNKNKVEKELMPVSRFNCNLVPEEGFLQCTEDGTYIVTFDNSYSYLRSKKLHYTVSIDEGYKPEDEDTKL